jgi:diaminopimelate epimerase
MAQIHFTKLSACGNDFLAIDNRDGRLRGDETGLIAYLCERRLGAGADGLLLLEAEADLDFRMRIFNPDGSEARMCGNGARACAWFAAQLGLGGADLRFSTRAGLQRAGIEGEARSRLWLSPPEARGAGESALRADGSLGAALGEAALLGFVRVGVPHLVCEVPSALGDFPVEQVGPILRHHAVYAPEGVNVMFARLAAPRRLELRAWEKGVEAETWGCGTGAVAACLLLSEAGRLELPAHVIMKGGELAVSHDDAGWSFAGEVHLSYEARAEIPASIWPG